MEQSTVLQHVLQYAKRGWPVLPLHNISNGAGECSCGNAECQSQGKHPRTARGLKDASMDETVITGWFAEWPMANIGIVTGEASGLVVLDVDPGGEDSLAKLEEQHGALPDTVQSLTGRGRHLLFKHPGFPIKNKVAVAPGVDVRGDGGYVVAPPSLHASGKLYAWELAHHPDEIEPAVMPQWLIALCNGADTKHSAAPPAGDKIKAGSRNATLLSLAGTMRRRGMSAEAIRAALEAENVSKCEPPLPASEVRQIAQSIGRYKAPEEQKPATVVVDCSLTPREALQVARATVQKWLKLENIDLVDIVLAVLQANKLPGDPVWVLIVGPSSSVKSEIIRGLKNTPGVHALSSFTGRTLASGFERVPSLLDKLNREKIKLIALKDFGSILSLYSQEKSEVMQQLREVYDGHYRKEFGNGKVVDWEGRLGFLAGSTPAIDKYAGVISELGDRFMLYRIKVDDREGISKKALGKSGQEENMRKEISSAFANVGFAVERQGVQEIGCEESLKDRIAALANLTSWCRTPVSRDWRTQAILYHPEPEGPGRLAKSFYKLSQGLSLIRGKANISESEYDVIFKIGRDSVPLQRTQILDHLYGQGDYTSTKQVGLALSLPTSTAQLILEELATLKLVDRVADIKPDEELKQTTPFKWCLMDEVRTLMNSAAAIGFEID